MSDRSSADDAGHAPSALETELRAALHERGAAVTTATLLRPDPLGCRSSCRADRCRAGGSSARSQR